MDSPTPRQWLSQVWALVFCLREHKLLATELIELRELCDDSAELLGGDSTFAEKAKTICDALTASGVFEGKRASELLDAVLDELREIRKLLP